MIKNNLDFITYLSNIKISIIDLVFISPELDLLYIYKITKKYFLLFDYKFTLVKWDKIEEKISKYQ